VFQKTTTHEKTAAGLETDVPSSPHLSANASEALSPEAACSSRSRCWACIDAMSFDWSSTQDLWEKSQRAQRARAQDRKGGKQSNRSP
jgi:hypothetical protein